MLNRRGFTLIELSISMLIVALITSGVVYFSPKIITRQKLRNNVWQIINDLKETQEKARANLEKLIFEFDIDNGTYKFEKKNNAINRNLNNLVIEKKLEKDIYFKSISINGIVYSSGIVKFMYDEWGTPKNLDNTSSVEVIIIVETPIIKNKNGENLSYEIKVSVASGMLKMIGPK